MEIDKKGGVFANIFCIYFFMEAIRIYVGRAILFFSSRPGSTIILPPPYATYI